MPASRKAVAKPLVPVLSKSEMTRQAIVAQALEMALREGMEALTLGSVAARMDMSKTGVFSRFGSMQALQLEVLKQYRLLFLERVWQPGMEAAEGLARVRALFGYWAWQVAAEQGGGCFYLSCAYEYDDRPGPIRAALLDDVQLWRAHLERCVQQAIGLGQLARDTDARQIVHEMVGLILVLHHDTRLLREARSLERTELAFARLLAAAQDASLPAIDLQTRVAVPHFSRRIVHRI